MQEISISIIQVNQKLESAGPVQQKVKLPSPNEFMNNIANDGTSLVNTIGCEDPENARFCFESNMSNLKHCLYAV